MQSQFNCKVNCSVEHVSSDKVTLDRPELAPALFENYKKGLNDYFSANKRGGGEKTNTPDEE